GHVDCNGGEVIETALSLAAGSRLSRLVEHQIAHVPDDGNAIGHCPSSVELDVTCLSSAEIAVGVVEPCTQCLVCRADEGFRVVVRGTRRGFRKYVGHDADIPRGTPAD